MPLVYNSGGYDRVKTLRLLAGIFDIYMPDFKFWDADIADACCHAPDYPEVARKAILSKPASDDDFYQALQAAKDEGITRLDQAKRTFLTW